ncbi:hypothetical protein ABL78_3674 [Leptomonas seymouri]|uniref:Uncharacterized protein n=1 Tax=Leptomonas seymouri TaxID=5684 RepID=A0A0N0P6J5_LEPSE|nr:hypothetical protein ABL78_3674 [Leptomonas seymouri]|eukprot:KPI87237.1 hypothetical protein ABL78_3674 [Leptomonas seymouri]
MFWVPVSGQLGANGAPPASYPMPMMSPGMVPAQPGAAVTPPTSNSALLSDPNMHSADFSASDPNNGSSNAVNVTPQPPMGASLGGGAGVPMAASFSGSTPAAGTTDPHRVYMMGASGLPVGYTPVMAPGCMPMGAVSMMPGGGYYSMAATPMAVYPPMAPSAGEFNASSSSAPLFVGAPGDFTAVSFSSIASTFSGTFSPLASSGVMWSESSDGPLRLLNSRSCRMGDAGRGYEAGVYYEGRVKRFNPVRGYGFLSATHKLIKLKDVRKNTAAKPALVRGSDALAETQGSTSTENEVKEESTKGVELKTSMSGISEDENQNPANLQALTTANTTVSAAGSGSDTPLIDIIAAAGTDVDATINLNDIVVIKGEEYVRKPVVMGDIFVHYHCLQRTPEELESEQSGTLVSLPAGARVQFKAEVFVPAKLMEEAQDSKQAAAMLNNIGIVVNEDPNLLAGAIATKKGWGYQAMNVVQLSTKHIGRSRRGHRGRFHRNSNSSTASMSSASSTRQSNTSSIGQSEQVGDGNALAPCSSHRLNIQVGMGNAQPPPPSFESATANMKYAVPTAGGMVYYPAYPSMMPKQL